MAKMTLSRPIKRGDDEIKSIELKEPNTGSLRNLRMTDVLNGDVDSIKILVPRISSPSLTKEDMALVSAPDLAEMSGHIIGFFMPGEK